MPISRQQKRATARKKADADKKRSTASATKREPAVRAAKLTDATRERWRAEAEQLAPDKLTLSIPIRVLLDEAPVVARFVIKRWSAKVDRRTKAQLSPGLSSVGQRLPRAIADEILQARAMVQEAHTQWILSASGGGVDPFVRGRLVLGEIRATLNFLFDDGVDDERDEQLARVHDAHADDGATREALASSLDDFAGLARPYAAEMHGLGGFDKALIDEAPALANTLRGHPVDKAEKAGAERDLLDMRNRYAALLQARIAKVRASARFVYRHHPDVVREVTSAWERNRRAASRRKQAAAATTATQTANPTATPR